MKIIQIPPMLLLGLEGVIATFAMLFFVLPIIAHLPGTDAFHSLENTHDSITMLVNSKQLRWAWVSLLCFGWLWNASCFICVRVLSSMHRTLIANGGRPLALWLTDLALFYVIDRGRSGEPWLGLASFVQLFGFILYFYGLLIYAGQILPPSRIIKNEQLSEPLIKDDSTINFHPSISNHSFQLNVNDSSELSMRSSEADEDRRESKKSI